MERCLACNGSGALDSTPEIRALAAQLVKEGWKQVSAKYRRIARAVLPSFDESVTLAPGVPDWLRKRLQQAYHSSMIYALRDGGDGIEQRELSPAEFRAYKKAGGGWW